MENTLLLTRKRFSNEATFGTLTCDEKNIYWDTIEPKDRMVESYPECKIVGHTAIPRGLYTLSYRYSLKLRKYCIQLDHVPNFKYIYIHFGKTVKNTRGCILVGQAKKENELLKTKVINDQYQKILEDIMQGAKWNIFID